MIKRSIPWTSQPQYPVATVPDLGVRYIYTPNSALQSRQTNAAYGVGRYGRQHSNSSTTSGGVTLSTVNTPRNGTTYSIFILAKITALSTSSTLFSIPHSTTWVAPWAPIIFRRYLTSTSLSVFHGQSGGSTEDLVSSTGAISADSLWHLFEVRRNGSTVYFYVDGVAYGTATATKTCDFSGSKLPTFFGAPPLSNTQGLSGECAYGFYSDLYLSDTQAVGIRNNIWSIFTPQQRNIYVDVASNAATANSSIITAVNTVSASCNVSPMCLSTITTAANTVSATASVSSTAVSGITTAVNTVSASSTVSPIATSAITLASNTVSATCGSSTSASAAITLVVNTVSASTFVSPIATSNLTTAVNVVSASANTGSSCLANITTSVNIVSANASVSPVAAANISQAVSTISASASSGGGVASCAITTEASFAAAVAQVSPIALMTEYTEDCFVIGSAHGGTLVSCNTTFSNSLISASVSSFIVPVELITKLYLNKGPDPISTNLYDKT